MSSIATPVVFFTGFPGFLCSGLLPRVLGRVDGAEAVCLVQPQYEELGRRRVAEIEARVPRLRGRIRLLQGDIARPGLGLAEAAVLQRDIAEIHHLAAVYDLSVGRDLAMRVNVDGTRHVLDFAGGCIALQRFQYVSTCYVSGAYPGVFREDDLEKGQRFNNYYEESKHLAEVEVRRRLAAGLPATIYRPAIVVGDSVTGATQKYDGPYFAIQWLLRQPRIAIVPIVGDPSRAEFNVVPRDFVLDAMAYLGGQPWSAGKTYQLADPRPLTIDGMLRELGRATGRRVIRLPLPHGLARWALDRVPGVYRLIRIPSSALAYQVHPTRYDTTNTLAGLEGSGIRCPPFPSYSAALIRFVRQHPEIGSAAMA